MTVKYTLKMTDDDIRTVMRALDYIVARAGNTEAPKYVIDRYCRAECIVQWTRIKAELYNIVGDDT